MKKISKILALLLAMMMLLAAFAGCSSKGTDADADTKEDTTAASDYETVKEDGVVVVGITDFAPMDYLDDNGEWTGFDAELARAVFAEMDLEVEFIEIDWDNKILELDAGSIDCVWNGMTLTDEVLNSMECSDPYVINAQVAVMSADVAGDYTEVDSLKDLTVAVEAGSAGASAANDAGYTNVIEVATQADALMEVAAGSADACVIDLTMANAMTGEGTSYANLTSAVELTHEEYGIGFRKGSDMAQMANDILAAMKEDGSMQELADKYNLTLCE